MIILAFANGVFMTMDGFHVMIKGKYIGPEKTWPLGQNLFCKFKINVFKLGPLFIILGLSWLLWLYGLWNAEDWAFIFGLIISVLTLWYIKVGTFISIIIIILLLIFKEQLGL